MRLAYLGTPDMAVPPLRALVDAGFDVVAVVTRVDKRRGRGAALVPSPVKSAAVEHDIPVLHRVDDLLALDIELGVVVAFGQIIKPHVLADIPMVNLHFSLLPRSRGAAPVERALLAGDAETGVCLMEMEEGLDTGGVYERRVVPIRADETADELRAELVGVGTAMLVARLRDGLGTPVPQHGEPTYAHKISPDELRLDWSRPPAELDRVVRLGERGRRSAAGVLKVASALLVGAEPGDVLDGDRVGGLRLLLVQPEGKAVMAWADFARGARPMPGERLGS